MILIYGSDLAVNFIVSANESGDGFSDPSANQRILETGLIINEINNSPLISQLLGKGFGAHYFKRQCFKSTMFKEHIVLETIF